MQDKLYKSYSRAATEGRKKLLANRDTISAFSLERKGGLTLLSFNNLPYTPLKSSPR
jgi:hypothetical protein